jgi:hypothetical protein
MSSQIITSEFDLADLPDALDSNHGSMPVVVDHRGEPWITYANEDGDWYAVTTPVEGMPYFQPMPFGQLLACQPNRRLRAVRTSAAPAGDQATFEDNQVRAVLQSIYELGRSAHTAPEHNAFMKAAAQLEQLLGVEPAMPPFTRAGERV